MDRSHYRRIGAITPVSNPLFILFAGLFALHYFLQNIGVNIPVADAYLDDLLCMPVVLSIALAGMRLFYKTGKLSASQIIFTVVYCSVLFELVLPLLSDRYTGDFLDIVLYGAGALFFSRFMNGGCRSRDARVYE